MSAGLAALLDDVAVLARAAAASIDDVGVAAAKAGSKAAGVVIDDAAVTPQYVRGLAAERELPIVKKIALGSLRNKFLIILPAILLLSQFVPWLLTPILMLGGAYLCYEGAEKVWEKLTHHEAHAAEKPAPDEKTLIAGAVRTDLILSAEIMVISLNEVADETFWSRLAILAVVAVAMTVAVYGAVGLIVKMDDLGLRLAELPRKGVAAFGRGLVKAMPKVMTGLTIVGTVAMLWVGGHILLVGTDELGLHFLYDFVHHVEVAAHDATGAAGAVVGWLVNTLFSAILGVIVGAIVVVAVTLIKRTRKPADADADAGAAAGAESGLTVTVENTASNAAPAANANPASNSASAAEAPPASSSASAGEAHPASNSAPASKAKPAEETGPGDDAGR